jgi:predicted TPR repeat methyltransferase
MSRTYVSVENATERSEPHRSAMMGRVTNDASATGWLVEGGSDPTAIAERYDEWAARYDDDLRSWDYRAPRVVAEQVVALHPAAEAALDAGCGTGLVGRELRRADYRGTIHGVDVSDASLEVAARDSAYTTLGRGDLQQPLPLANDSFDVVVCIGVMTYVPDVEAIWREFARVVRPGGLIVVTQREDLWDPRDCQGVIDQMSGDGIWGEVDVSEPAPYLPGNTDGMAPLGVYYLTARVREGSV